MTWERILVRATNWLGDAVMSLPALRALRKRFPGAGLAVLARPGVADLFRLERVSDEVIAHPGGNWSAAGQLRGRGFEAAVLFPNSFEAALGVWLARIPERIGYARDGRGPLLTRAIAVPKPGEIPRHESRYYLELLVRAGLIEAAPAEAVIELECAARAREAGARRMEAAGFRGPVIGVSPGAVNSRAKQWPRERFVEAAALLARDCGAAVAVFGAAQERALCESVAEALRGRRHAARSFAGETKLEEFIELAAACAAFLTNDSGAMHVASALGVPTVAVFGPTDYVATAPAGPRSRIVREPVECSPCMLRDCPIDHRCMARVSAERVAQTALELLQ